MLVRLVAPGFRERLGEVVVSVQQVRSAVLPNIMAAAAAVQAAVVALAVLVVVVLDRQRPALQERQIQAAAVVVVARHLVRIGQVARVVQESSSSTMPDHNGRLVERLPVLAAERFTHSPAVAL